MSNSSPTGKITLTGKILVGLGVLLFLLAIVGFISASGAPRSNEDDLGKGILTRLSVLISIVGLVFACLGACLRKK